MYNAQETIISLLLVIFVVIILLFIFGHHMKLTNDTINALQTYHQRRIEEFVRNPPD